MTDSAAGTPPDGLDSATQCWRQGDCVLGGVYFAHRFDGDLPLTPESTAAQASDSDADICDVAVEGLVVLTQSCDIVREHAKRPFVEVAPLVKIADTSQFQQIEKQRFVRYAAVPALAERYLVADLDRVMTVEKAFLAKWEQIVGCRTDQERRDFADALARKHSRFAFPSTFNTAVSGLKSRIVKSHGKDTDEGRALAAISEIRVKASPSWGDDQVELFFWFIRDGSEPAFVEEDWPGLVDKWTTLVLRTEKYVGASGVVANPEDMTALDYLESDRLDLDHLSGGEEAG